MTTQTLTEHFVDFNSFPFHFIHKNIKQQQQNAKPTHRVTIAFFAVCGLDVLDRLHLLSDEMRKEIVDWVYSYQIVPSHTEPKTGGFVGSSTLNIVNTAEKCGIQRYKWGHLAMTYTGIAILVTLGDDLSRLNRRAIVEGVAAVQRPDGSFSATIEGSEHDMRFVYCAAAICAMINEWGDVNKTTLAQYIRNSLVRVFCVYVCGDPRRVKVE